MELGYEKPLFILPFDHRSSFAKNMFGVVGTMTAEQREKVIDFKNTIYSGFTLAANDGVAREAAAILVDEEFGDTVLRKAKDSGYTVCLSVEKSGQEEFDFEYGDQFEQHIEKYQPTFAKALIRYNPESDIEMNQRQRQRLKRLSDFCHHQGYKFLIEPLIPATAEQLKKVSGDKEKYDNEIRPHLMVKMITELQTAGVEPDVWKIEGLLDTKHYAEVLAQARIEGRTKVSAIILGRGADDRAVEAWLRAGAPVAGIIGFAIGRTVFWQPIRDYFEAKITREDAADQIAKRYRHYYQLFKSAQA